MNQLRILLLLLLVTIGEGIGAGQAVAQQIRYLGSVQYATGSYYFTQRTNSFYFTNGLGINYGNINAYLNVPLISQNTPWISYSSTGLGPLPTGGPRNGVVPEGHGRGNNGQGKRKVDLGSADTLNYIQTSFGDPSLMISVSLFTSSRKTTIINGNWGVKFPLADANEGFGTGAWDIGGGLSWSQRFLDHWLFMLSGMYWQLGDMNELDISNILSYSTGLGRSFMEGKLMGSFSFFGSTQIIDGIDPPLSLGTGLNYQITKKLSINGNALVGISESASDFSIGLGWNITL